MLRVGGAIITLCGFRRVNIIDVSVEGCEIIDIGRSFDSRLVHRIWLVFSNFFSVPKEIYDQRFDIIIARNLEMLVLSQKWRRELGGIPVVYECLDIHRLMFGSGTVSVALRLCERRLIARCKMLVLSSPAFFRNYFAPIQNVNLPVRLVENKVFFEIFWGKLSSSSVLSASDQRPWRIGWFGMIRCMRSIEFLIHLVSSNPGLVEVVIAGRPTKAVFQNFSDLVAGVPGLKFIGEYEVKDLPRLYESVHFTWAIDFFEEGQNSAFLLPNRIYEGMAFGSVPIALDDVETGHWLRAHGAGILIGRIDEVENVLKEMTRELFEAHADAISRIARKDIVTTEEECIRFVQDLKCLSSGGMVLE